MTPQRHADYRGVPLRVGPRPAQGLRRVLVVVDNEAAKIFFSVFFFPLSKRFLCAFASTIPAFAAGR